MIEAEKVVPDRKVVLDLAKQRLSKVRLAHPLIVVHFKRRGLIGWSGIEPFDLSFTDYANLCEVGLLVHLFNIDESEVL